MLFEGRQPLKKMSKAARSGLLGGTLHFKPLSDAAQALISSRKLWDFMENIPLDEDPRQVCRGLIMEFAEKAENN